MSLAALGATLMIAPAAWAGCGDTTFKQPAVWDQGTDQPQLLRAAYGQTSIVGLWSVQFTAGGQVVDFGYSEWHADGTEILNSGGHHPATQNFCLGAWRQTGPFSYHLNHWALSYSPDVPPPGSPVMPAVKVNIVEDVMLDPKANTFQGTFTITPYDFASGKAIPGGAVTGQVQGQRVIP